MTAPRRTGSRDRSRWLYPAAVVVAILASSSVPGRPLPHDPGLYGLFGWIPPEVQNLLHLPAYGLLAWSWCVAPLPGRDRSAARLASAVLLTVAVGFLDEAYQSLVPGRYPSLADAALDVAGAIAGATVFVLARSRSVAAGVETEAT